MPLRADMHRMEATPPDFERIFELSGELLCVIADGVFARVSAGWEAHLGWSADDLVGRRCVELIHPEDLDRTLTESTEGVSGENELLAFENRYRHRDGSYRWLAWNARSFEDDVIYAVTSFLERRVGRSASSPRRTRAALG